MPDPLVRQDPPALDTDLVRRAQKGDTAAFEPLYRRHAGRVYALCLRLTADPVRAGVLVQDAFVRAWQMLPTFRGESAFSSWMHRLAVNVVLADFRSRQRRAARFSWADEMEAYDQPAPSSLGMGMDLENAISTLPSGARTVFVLHDVEGYKHDEIGQLLEIAPGTSRAQLHRARQLLRAALGDR